MFTEAMTWLLVESLAAFIICFALAILCWGMADIMRAHASILYNKWLCSDDNDESPSEQEK